MGEVVAVGEGMTSWSEAGGSKCEEVEFNGAKHLLLKRDDIVGILETDHVKDLKPLNERVLIKVASNDLRDVLSVIFGLSVLELDMVDSNGIQKELTAEPYEGDSEIAEAWFDQAAEYWKQAIALTPGNYIEALNWLKITRRFE
ncbi:photosystem I assembly protein Ycf3 [Tanacetum coccineum]